MSAEDLPAPRTATFLIEGLRRVGQERPNSMLWTIGARNESWPLKVGKFGIDVIPVATMSLGEDNCFSWPD